MFIIFLPFQNVIYASAQYRRFFQTRLPLDSERKKKSAGKFIFNAGEKKIDLKGNGQLFGIVEVLKCQERSFFDDRREVSK